MKPNGKNTNLCSFLSGFWGSGWHHLVLTGLNGSTPSTAITCSTHSLFLGMQSWHFQCPRVLMTVPASPSQLYATASQGHFSKIQPYCKLPGFGIFLKTWCEPLRPCMTITQFIPAKPAPCVQCSQVLLPVAL